MQQAIRRRSTSYDSRILQMSEKQSTQYRVRNVEMCAQQNISEKEEGNRAKDSNNLEITAWEQNS